MILKWVLDQPRGGHSRAPVFGLGVVHDADLLLGQQLRRWLDLPRNHVASPACGVWFLVVRIEGLSC
jgi:hypothetical protein